MTKWRVDNPRMRVLEPWVTLATLVSSILHTAVGGIAQYNVCTGEGGAWQGVMFALLIMCEVLTVLLWTMPVRDTVRTTHAVYGLFAHFLVGILFTATLYMFNDVVDGTITFLAILLRIPQTVMYVHSTPLVVYKRTT
jgi:hypothetical protein